MNNEKSTSEKENPAALAWRVESYDDAKRIDDPHTIPDSYIQDSETAHRLAQHELNDKHLEDYIKASREYTINGTGEQPFIRVTDSKGNVVKLSESQVEHRKISPAASSEGGFNDAPNISEARLAALAEFDAAHDLPPRLPNSNSQSPKPWSPRVQTDNQTLLNPPTPPANEPPLPPSTAKSVPPLPSRESPIPEPVLTPPIPPAPLPPQPQQ